MTSPRESRTTVSPLWRPAEAPTLPALIQRRAEVQLHSALDDATVRAAHLIPCRDIGTAVRARLQAQSRIAVLPQGPLTIPYVSAN